LTPADPGCLFLGSAGVFAAGRRPFFFVAGTGARACGAAAFDGFLFDGLAVFAVLACFG